MENESKQCFDCCLTFAPDENYYPIFVRDEQKYLCKDCLRINGILTNTDLPFSQKIEKDIKYDYAVDVPDGYTKEWLNVGYFETKEQAIRFCQEEFGADENGNINLVSFIGNI